MTETPDATAAEQVTSAPSETPPAPSGEGAPRMYDASYVDSLRKENAGWRTKLRDLETSQSKHEQTMQALAAALGLGEGAAPDPAQLTAQLSASQAEARQRAVELAVVRAAGRLGADADALLDSRGFTQTLDGLDPSDADAITAAIQAAVEASPRLKSAPAAMARSSAEIPGGTGTDRQLTRDDIRRMTPEQIVEARDKGLLRALLGG